MADIKLCDRCQIMIKQGDKFGMLDYWENADEFRSSNQMDYYKTKRDICEKCHRSFIEWWNNK